MSDEKILGKNFDIKDIKKTSLALSNDGKIDREQFHHEELMDQMVKAIQYTKMHKKIRSILLLRLIHGFTIQRMQIHLFLHGHIFGNSHDELMALEAEGKRLVMETLKKTSMQDIISSINANPSVIAGLRHELTTSKDDLGLS